MTRPFTIAIDELVVEGIEPSERALVAGALERELTRLISEQGVSPTFERPLEISSVAAATRAAATGAEALGAELALALYEALPR